MKKRGVINYSSFYIITNLYDIHFLSFILGVVCFTITFTNTAQTNPIAK